MNKRKAIFFATISLYSICFFGVALLPMNELLKVLLVAISIFGTTVACREFVLGVEVKNSLSA